jgi:GNAT superfamily N-acetyltransferase
MTPLYDANVRLVGFFDGTCLFDVNNDWIAFHDAGDVFACDGRWLGPLKDGSFLDHDGMAVAWLAGSRPTTGMKPSPPMNPKRPLHPKRPLRPRTPLPPPVPMRPGGGWSKRTWAQWMGHAPVPDAVKAEVSAVRIEAVAAGGFDALFDYLGGQLAENGCDGPYFQAMPRGECDAGVPADTQRSFSAGLVVPVGEPGWRRAWVARDAGGRVIGHVDLRAHPELHTGHRCLLGMGVGRVHRRIGIGRWLLAHAVQWAADARLRWIDLRVLSSNEPAVTLYRMEGFQMQGGTPDMFVVDGQSFGDLFMSKKVTR